jgi:integrase
VQRGSLDGAKRNPGVGVFPRFRCASSGLGQFLSSLARESHVSASAQHQALNALLFLYQVVLGQQIGYLAGVVRAKRPRRLPVVSTQEEVGAILRHLHDGPLWLMAMLLYGAGLRRACYTAARLYYRDQYTQALI